MQALGYEKRLAQRPESALSEGERFFKSDSEVHQALREIASRLEALGIPYAVVGGLALFAHGFRRFTEDIDILVNRQGLRRIHDSLEGRGYLPPFEGSKNLRDTAHRVKIEFLVTGDFPGDGKPKPVSFPDPETAAITVDGIRYIGLQMLVELKLASGMTNAARMKDLADVVELIKILKLDAEFASLLDPFVRPKYLELWESVRGAPRRFVRLWRNKFLTVDAKSLEDMATTLRAAAEELAEMLKDGVALDPDGGTGDDYAQLVTYDPAVARKWGFDDEDELWGAETADSTKVSEAYPTSGDDSSAAEREDDHE